MPLVVLLAWPAIGLGADAVDMRQLRLEVEQLKANQVRLERELADLKERVGEGVDPSKPVVLDLGGIDFLGEPDAPVTLIEFTDARCPFCRRHAATTMPLLKAQYVDTGKLRYGIREFPVEALHQGATKVSEALLCAGNQGAYWAVQGRLAELPGVAPDAGQVGEVIKDLGLDARRFDGCLASGQFGKRVRDDIRIGSEIGVTGTPTFYLGVSTADDRMRVVRVLRGAQPFLAFKRAIDSLMAVR